MIKKLCYFLIIFASLALPAISKEIYETEQEFYAWHSRYEAIEPLPYELKLKQLRELLKDNDLYSSDRLIDYKLLFAQDLVNKGITNYSLIREYITNACYWNISLSRFRMKDPNFNIYFENNITDDTEARNFYDKLVDKNWILDNIDSMSTSQKNNTKKYLCKIFKITPNENLSNEENTKLLKIAKLYFEHPDFKKKYFCGNTLSEDKCFTFIKFILGDFATTSIIIKNDIAVNFIEQMLLNPNTDTDNLKYFCSTVKFNKKPSEKLIKAIQNNEFSEDYPIYYSSVSSLEKDIKSRSELISILKSSSAFNEKQKTWIILNNEFSTGEKVKIVKLVINTPMISDKGAAVIKIFNNKKEIKDTLEAFWAAATFPYSFIKMLESIP